VPDIVLGVLAVLIGALLCFRGYAALRVVIAAWGAFAGFLLGAGIVAQVTGEGFLASVLAWTIGLLIAAAFGLLAYLYYAISVVIGMGAIGFSLGTTLMVVLGVTWSWAIIAVGLIAGVGLAMLAIAGDLPLLILAVLGAFAGASVAVAGLLLIFGQLGSEELAATETSSTLELGWWWTVGYLVLAIAGLAFQLGTPEMRRGSLRGSWAGGAGGAPRSA
jgi:hypothetical protein